MTCVFLQREEEDMLKKISLFVCSIAVIFSLTACNTTKGVGEDVEAGGEAIQRAAQ
ncbi:entericidin A/B family lipoprotein [Vibrio parahaemolyticus]